MAKGIKHIMYKYPDRKQKDLIPILQDIQNEHGFISEEHIHEITKTLDIPGSRIYGIATFYNQFKFKQPAEIHIRICSGSACHVMGGDSLWENLRSKLNIQENGRSKDGKISIEEVPCLGSCALAPVIQVNDTYHTRLNKKKIDSIIDSIKNKPASV
ncbi:MAG TPA: NAD(P)H-dependent oxidoreductase subunit E [Bacteroidales bacterium]|nr:NAD(P)H-dependent oxidoreductase subunit E [Bacteroidales bacterium]